MTTSIQGPRPTGWSEWGVDLSSYNGLSQRHWDWLASNSCNFAILRACKALTPDTHYMTHLESAELRGIRVGAYLLLRPESESPISKQVELLVARSKVIRDKPYLLAIDIEGDWHEEDQPKTCLRRALWLTLKATGQRPYVYTYPAFYKRWLGGPVIRAFPLWGARYAPIENGRRANKPIEWASESFGRPVALWQYGGGPVDGGAGSPAISKDVRP